MKTILLIFATLLSFSSNSQTNPGFTVTNTNGSYAITCATPTLNFTANSTNNLTYVWNGPSSTHTGSNVNISIPGTYTVVGTDTTNTSSNYIFTVVMNTFVPNSSISPTIASVSCSLNTATTFTGTTNTPNCTHKFLSPFGGTVYSQNSSAYYTPIGPGFYTLVTTDNANGCSSIKNFSISTNSGFPIFSIISPQNYTLGCTNNSFVTVLIVNASATNSLQIPTGGAVSYTIIGPTTSTSTPSGTLSGNYIYSLSTAGTWTAIVKDNSYGCETRIPFSIVNNTTTPNITISVPNQLLDCNTITTKLKGSSSTPNVSYKWTYVGTPGTSYSDTLNIHANIFTPTNTLVGNYTLTVKDMSSNCESHSVIPLYQNVFTPNAAISSGGVDSLPCILSPTILLTNVSSSGIPSTSGYPTNMPVIGLLWKGPSPLAPSANSSSYIAGVAGIYSLTAKDLNNGCISHVTKFIFDGCNKVGLLNNMLPDNAIRLFPNPNKGIFTLHSDNVLENNKIEIYSSLGVLVRTEKLSSEKTIINIEGLANGIYILQIFENNKIVYYSKIIKE